MNQRREIEQERRRRNKKRSPIPIIIIIVLVLALILGGGAWAYYRTSLAPVDTSTDETVEIQVQEGQSLANIADQLEDQGLIKDARAFKLYSRLNNSQPVQAGYYLVSPNMSAEEILNILENEASAHSSEAIQYMITVPEGSTIDQIADAVAQTMDVPREDFIQAVENEALIQSLDETYPGLLTGALEAQDVTRYTLEGYLYPATYTLYEDEHTLEDLVFMMVDKMYQELQPYTADIEASDLSLHEVLSLAAITEMEAPETEDRRIIAGIFHNRLEVGMPMQTDISILYILQDDTVIPTFEDLQIDNPYNLYMYTGLGPGPMNNPSIESIDAVLNPVETDYYYFLADLSTGEVYYAETYEEHQQNISLYLD